MFEGLYFEHPKLISLIVIFIACDAYCKLRSRGLYFPHVKALTATTHSRSTLMWIAKWLGIVLLSVAIASPVKDDAIEVSAGDQGDLVVVMQAKHLNDLKKQVLSLLDAVTSDHLGVIIYDDKSTIISALSDEKSLIKAMVQAYVPQQRQKRDDLVLALQQGLRLLERSEDKHKEIVLITADLSSLQKDFEALNDQLLSQNVHLTIMNARDTFSDEEERWKKLVKMSGGSYAKVDKASMRLLSTKLNRDNDRFDYVFKTYYYIYPLFLSFLSLLLYVYLRNRRGWL